jgi:uncharacterized protein YyaL (SSP411 family)
MRAALRVAALALLAVPWAVSCARARPAIDPLPGATTYPAELRERLADALAARGRDYRPRTRHLRPDGSPRWTNRLILESSPYLLQHAHNPVDWYPWGDEAFARAAAESKPVLLSVGYSTCHWCHVMEEESFDDEDVAEYLNRNYVAIKVDREVRPDVDGTYMTVVQMLTGGGGWPMTVWLTPVRQPFAGATYLPRAKLLDALRELRGVFDAEPLQVAAQAGEITARVKALAAPPAAETLPDAAVVRAAYARLAAGFDATNGGFGRRPKFPSPPELDFLLRYHRRTRDAHALDMVTLTLAKIAAGGIHDQIGGGFHRYATDAAWQVPHFEKTLYDNAQLAATYLAAWQVTKRDDLAAVIHDVLDYLAREMSAPDGGFFAAMDADSDGEEGKFFVWTPGEIRAALDDEHARAALAWWDVSGEGSFRGRSILHVARPADDVARELGVHPARLATLVGESRERLYAARARRVPPHTDRKIVAAWNGLAISAFARAGAALGEPRWTDRARAAAAFVIDRMRVDGRLRRSWSDGAPHEDAFVDDYAFVIAGLLDLYEATFDLRWLREAIALDGVLAREYADPDGGGFFQTAADHEVTLARQKPDDEGAVPSGNAVAALDLLRLAEFTGDARYRDRADGVLRAFGASMERGAAPALASALEARLDRTKEIVIVRPRGDDGDGALAAAVRATFVPNRILTVATEGAELARQQAVIPLVAEKRALGGVATAYVCEEKVCALPTSDPSVLVAQLARLAPLGP